MAGQSQKEKFQFIWKQLPYAFFPNELPSPCVNSDGTLVMLQTFQVELVAAFQSVSDLEKFVYSMTVTTT